MRNLTLAMLAATVSVNLLGGQPKVGGDPDPFVAKTVAKWEKLRATARSLDCSLVVTTTNFARKAPLTGKVLYPRDITTEMKIEAKFDLANGSYSIHKIGEEYSLTKQAIAKYEDRTVFKDGRLYGLLVPPAGKSSSVGGPTDSSSDLAIIDGELSSFHLGQDISPVLIAAGVVALSPTRELHPGNWNRYSLSALADIMASDKFPNEMVVRERQDNLIETRFRIDENGNLVQRIVKVKDSPADTLVYKYNKTHSDQEIAGWTRETANKGQVYSRQTCVVTRLLINGGEPVEITPPIPSPGMIVAKVDLSQPEQNRGVPKSLDHYIVDEQGAMKLLQSSGREAEGVRTWKFLLLGLSALVCTAATVVLVRRWNSWRTHSPKRI